MIQIQTFKYLKVHNMKITEGANKTKIEYHIVVYFFSRVSCEEKLIIYTINYCRSAWKLIIKLLITC